MARPKSRAAYCLAIALFALSVPPPSARAQSYTFTHLAGSVGGAGFEDGTASAARFNQPAAVAVDASGNVYVADSSNHTIRRVTFGGVVTTLAGLAGSPGSSDGPGSSARFNAPRGVAVDGAGNVYVADSSNHTIRKVTSSGVVTTLAGLAGVPGNSNEVDGSRARFNHPVGLAIDGAGSIYVADSLNHTIRKVTSGGVVTLAGLPGTSGTSDGTGTTARFSAPSATALDGAGNIYVADYGNHTIRKVTPSGVVTTLAGMAGSAGSTDASTTMARFSSPSSVAVDASGNVFIADRANHTIRKVTLAGEVSTPAGLAGTFGSSDGTGTEARFDGPEGVAVDGAGNIYVADLSNHSIRKVTIGGVVSTLAGMGRVSGSNSPARLSQPAAVAVDGIGNVYVADSSNHTIRKVTSGGAVTTLAGRAGFPGRSDGLGSAASFNAPRGITVDGAGNVYVADSSNHTIRKVTSGGEVTTLAGLAGVPGTLDAVSGTGARFNNPVGLAIDGAGSIYVADSVNHTIRKVTSGGAVSTLAGLAGTSGTGDGTVGARFNAPSATALDGAGNIYVADYGSNTIRKITPSGVVTTLAGFAGSAGSADGTTLARFNQPSSVAVDGGGNVFVADRRNHTIRKVTSVGVVSTLAGFAGSFGNSDGTGTVARFDGPEGVAVDGAGNIYVADLSNHTIRKVTVGGVVTTFAGLPSSSGSDDDAIGGSALFYFPQGVAVDGTQNVYVADGLNHTIRKVITGGAVTTLAGRTRTEGSQDGTGSSALFFFPTGVAVDGAGNSYVAVREHHTIRKITSDGRVTTLAGVVGNFGLVEGSGSVARFNAPAGVAVDGVGNVYVADSGNNRIRKVTSAGAVSTLAVGFNAPEDVAVDSFGNVYVADTGSHTIRKVTSSGVVSTLAGMAGSSGSSNGTGNIARFNQPYGVAVDVGGNVYVADTFNETIRKVTGEGVVTTLGGSPGTQGASDGNAAAARFANPYSVAVDNVGNLYVADSRNHAIRLGSPSLADVATIDQSTGPVGVVRQLGTAPSTATSWEWSLIRRPAGSAAQISSPTIRNPTFTPDAPGLFIFRLRATSSTGSSITTVDLNAIPVPTIISFTPSSGFPGASVTITGTNLTGVTAVTFNGTAAASFVVNSESQITATVAGGSTSGLISVTTPGGSVSSGSTFTVVIPAPTISSFSPASGVPGTSVTVLGTNFSNTSLVELNGSSASFTIVSSTQLTFTVPSGSTAGTIRVTTPGGSVTSGSIFSVGPTISTVSPAGGPPSGGQSVTITGTNLGSASVLFGGVAATVTSNGPTSVTVTTPARAAGVVDVSVTTPGGTATKSAAYSYATGPAVTEVAPSSGPLSGGQTVTITGGNLGSATSVTIGGVAATISSNTATSITVTTPARAAGVVDVSVTNAGGTGTKAAAYTYAGPPTVSTVSPSIGPLGGGQSVTITGADLGSAVVTFGGTAATVTSNSPTSVTVSTPARPAGVVDVSVTTPSGTAARTSAYTYAAAPTIFSIAPSSGPLAGGQSVTITGTNLASATVDFGGAAAALVSNTGTSVMVLTPARGAGLIDVSITTPGGTVTRTAGYTFAGAPSVSAVSPSSGTTAGGTAVTITGSGFVTGATVAIGGVAATTQQVVSSSTITATTPARAAGAVSVVVTNPDGQAGTLASGYIYVPIPAITSFSPSFGLPLARISIFGSNFLGVTLVEFNGTSAIFEKVSDLELSALVPRDATSGPIRLTAPAGSVTTPGTFTVGPTISAVAPAGGPLSGGQSVTITGTNLGSAFVSFGDNPATVTSNSATSITVSSPAHAAGVVDVSVTTLGGTAKRTAAYTYAVAPTISTVSPSQGGTSGGRVITISGSGFSSGTSVTVGGTAATRVALVDSATLSVTIPAHAAGVVDVVVTSGGQSATASGVFTYVPPGAFPTITSITPSTGSTSGGTAITIAGTNFSSDATVTIGGELAREFRVTGTTSISAITPPRAAGAVAVVVTNGDGQSTTSASGFTYGCSAVATPSLTTPSNNAVDTSTSPVLTFSTTAGAFRYDVHLDTVDPPVRVVARDLAADTSAATISFTPSNLVAGTKYFWRVVAKGDPACLPVSTASSPVQSFTTIQACTAPGSFTLTAPAENAAGLTGTVQLTWSAATGAARYEVFLGNGTSFSSLGSTSSTSFSATGLAAGTTYSWNVVAHATCNETLTTVTPRRSFTIGGACAAAGAFSLTTPTASETNVSPAPELKWSASANASSYDLFLDTVSPPRLFRGGVSRTSVSLAGLLTGRTYFWKVVANVACDSTRSSSTAIASFTIRGGCVAPGKPEIKFAPGSVATNQSYVISWSEVADLDADGSYIIERSLSSSFSPILDSQLTGSSFASFTSVAEVTVHHRVRAIPSCGVSGAGPNSDTKSVTVTKGRPNVVFTVNPSAVVTNVGEAISDKKTRFTIENITNAPVQLILGKLEINSNPFFTVTDPTDPGAFLITLQPRKPKSFEVRFNGPTTSQAGSYQGLVFISAVDSAFLPYAFVNLKVGGQGSAKPEFRIGTTPTELLSLPAFSGEDANRPAVEVDVFNPGSTPMELAAEVGPEAWLVPENGWNASPIQPNSSVKVRLLTRRERSPAGSVLPRYTYFTVRTRTGESARLLVQDRETSATGSGRASSLEPGVRSYIIPRVVSMTTGTGRPLSSRLRLSNVSGDTVQAELFFTPAGIGGFDASAVKRASLLLPPNDVVSFTDPLVQLFGLTPPLSGSLEVRAAAGKIGSIDVSSSFSSNAQGRGQRDGKMPALIRGEGARVGSSHVVGGLRAGTGITASLALVETSGLDRASVRVALYDKEGVKKGEQVVEMLPYELEEIPNLLATLGVGATSLDAARIVLTVESGAGAVAGVVTLTDATTDGTAALIGQPVPSISPAKRASTNLHAAMMSPLAWVTPSALTEQRIVPLAVHGALSGSTTHTYRTSLSLTAPLDGAAGFTLRYTAGEAALPIDRPVNLAAGKSVEYVDVLEELFGIAATAKSQGQILVSTDRGQVYATLSSTPVGTTAWTLIGSVPVVTPQSEALTGAGGTMQRPLLIDGVEQSVDASRGTRWSMLLNEISGQAATVTVRLYEAGNRSAAIAEKSFTVAALSQTKLETLFAAMDLDTDLRQKDRTNVMAVVTASGGTGMVAATAVVVDNVTGDAEAILLAPRGGVPATGVARVSAVRTVEVTAPLFRRADVNGDGTIAVADIFYMINALFTNGPAPIGSGDANSDGSFSVADIFYLISFLFTNGPAPAS